MEELPAGKLIESGIKNLQGNGRAAIARQRLPLARAALENCRLCAHECGVNRVAGELGLCHVGVGSRVFSAQVEVSDELELIPTFAIALSGCDLRCAFCITGAQSWNPVAGEAVDAVALALRVRRALQNGARSVMILGGEPTVHVCTALELVAAFPEDTKLIWKTNAHGTAQARALLDGLFDVWLADYKFGNDTCAHRLSGIHEYNRVVRENLLWANGHSELIVRHLVMPGHVQCCWKPVAEWLAANLPSVKVNLRSGFWPAWHARWHPELRRSTAETEAEEARRIAGELNLRLIE